MTQAEVVPGRSRMADGRSQKETRLRWDYTSLVRLNSGTLMPQVGFGVFRIPSENTERAVHQAVECGYRSIDTAALYGNEAAVGRAIASCGVPREELFITTKLWNDGQGYASAFRKFSASLHRMNLDYVDLYLIHWPKPEQNRYVETWTALEAIVRG